MRIFAAKARLATALMSGALLTALWPQLAMAQTSPVITGYTTNSSQSVLTITGSNFGSTSSTVSIDGTNATVVSWSNTSVQVQLSSTAAPGTLTLSTTGGISTTYAFAGVERGYYTMTASGQVTAHGNVATYGDLTTLTSPPTSPAVEIVPTQNAQGYWILTQNGTVYGFGDATNFGSVNTSITAVAMAPANPQGTGVLVLSSTGTVYTLGQATNYGNAPSGTTATSIASTPSGQGYWILGQNGTVYPFGDASNLGSANVSVAPSAQTVSYPSGTLVQVNHKGPVFLVNQSTLFHVPNIAVLRAMGDTIAKVKSVPDLNGYNLGAPMIVPYVDGTVLHDQSTHTYYWVHQGILRPFSSQSVFSASKIPTSLVHTVTTLKPNWPVGATESSPQPYTPQGSLYRLNATHAVYILDNGTLDRIATGAVFNGMGLNWKAVHNVTALPQYPQGSPITTPAPLLVDGSLWRVKGAVYVVQNGHLRHIPSAKVFNSVGFSWHNIANLPSLGSLDPSATLDSTTLPAAVSSSTQAVDLVPTVTGQGYWILLADGQVQTLGNAQSQGEPTLSQIGSNHAVSMSVTPDGGGYTILTRSGTEFSYGDAIQPQSSSSGTVSLSMSPLPNQTTTTTSPTSSGGFFSMAYGSFMPNYDGSYTTMVDNPKGLSAIIPTWYYEQQNPTTLQWGAGSPPQGASSVVAQAHSEGIQVWPMVGATSVGPFQTAHAISSTVSQLVQDAVQHNYDGLTIDFEPSQFNGLSMRQASQQYTNFVAKLGPALKAVGKKLMVDTYAAFYPSSPYNLSAIAPYVTYINIMTYGHFDSATEAGPNAGLPWMQSVYQSAIGEGVSPSQIIMGFGPYGDYWSFNNSGLDKNAPLGNDSYVSDSQVQQLLLSNPNIVPVWNPTYQSEMFMTNEYVNSKGQWTVNPNGQAVAPTGTYSTSDQSKFIAQVQNLQGLLNYILVRYAVEQNQTVPSYLNLNQDGHYGSLTAEAVTQFQQDFNVTGATPGKYDTATKTALQNLIHEWNLGEYQYWVDTSQSMQNRVQQVATANNLGGMAVWRVPFETSKFWSTLESTVTVANSGQGGATQ